MSFRNTIKRAARLFRTTIVSDQHAAINFVENPPGTTFDLILLQRFPNLHGLRFIQIGANDGQRFDPLERYIERFGWSGVMFEPLAENFAHLAQRHGKNPRLKLRQAAVDAKDDRRVLYNLDHRNHPTLPDWAKGTGSFSYDRVLTVAHELGLDARAIVEEQVDTVSWHRVWQEFGSTPCDLLVLDTEGYDLALLRGAGLAEHRPRLIHFEHACVELTERIAFYRDLVELGYEIATDGPDTTAWLKA